MKRRLQLFMLILLYAAVMLFPCLAGCVTLSPAEPIAIQSAVAGTSQTFPINTTDQSGTIRAALDRGVRTIYLAPGLHRLAKTITIPEGTSIVGYGATLDLAMDGWAFMLQGSLHLEGVEIIQRTPTQHTQLATGNAGNPRIGFHRVNCGVRTTVQNIQTIGATDSVFTAVTMWRSARIENCLFLNDCYIGGQMRFVGNVMHGRLIANNATGGLLNSTVQRVRWNSWLYRHNEAECLLFEDCDVIGNTFSDLEFRGGCTTLMTWWVNAATYRCYNNSFRNITSDGPTAIGFRFFGGVVDGNVLTNITLHRIMLPFLLDKGCKVNTLDNIYIVDCVPALMQGGFEPWAIEYMDGTRKRFVIDDQGEATNIHRVRINGARGVPSSNRPERIKSLIVN